MIFDGEKKVYILSEQEYDEMFDGESHANLELIKVRNQLQEANEVIESFRTYDFTVNDENAEAYQVKWNVKAERFYKNKKWGVK